MLAIPDAFLNLMYETNLQKKKDVIERFLGALQKFKSAGRRIVCNESTTKHVENALRVAIELVEESNLMLYWPGLRIGRHFFELLPAKAVHRILVKQFVSHAVAKFNLKQSVNAVVKQCFELVVARRFLSLEVVLKMALNFICKSKFLNVKEFALDWLAGRFVRRYSLSGFREAFLAKLEPAFSAGGGFGSTSRRGPSTSKPRFSSVRKTFSSRQTQSRKKSQKTFGRSPSVELDAADVVLRILEGFKSAESNMKTQRLISRYIKVYVENYAKRTASAFRPRQSQPRPEPHTASDRGSLGLTKPSIESTARLRGPVTDQNQFASTPSDGSAPGNPVELFLERIEAISDMESFAEFVEFYRAGALGPISRRVKFKVVSQKMEFIFREVVTRLDAHSRLLRDFVGVFVDILSATEREKLFVLTLTFVGINRECDWGVFDALFGAVKRPFKCFNFSYNIIRENFGPEDLAAFDRNVTRYFKDRLEASLATQSVFFRNNLSLIIESVLRNCLESEFQEEFVGFLEKCCRVHGEDLLAELVSGFVRNDHALASFGLELVRSFSNQSRPTGSPKPPENYATQPPESEATQSRVTQSEATQSQATQSQTDLAGDFDTLPGTKHADTVGHETISNLDELRLSTSKPGLVSGEYPTISQMQKMLDSNRGIDSIQPVPRRPKNFNSFNPRSLADKPDKFVRQTVEIKDIRAIELDAQQDAPPRETEATRHSSAQYASPELKRLDQSPNYKLQRLQHLQNRREQRQQSSKFQAGEDAPGRQDKRVTRTKDFIIKTTADPRYSSNSNSASNKDLNEVQTAKQYKKAQNEVQRDSDAQSEDFQSVPKIKVFTTDKAVQTDSAETVGGLGRNAPLGNGRDELSRLAKENDDLRSELDQADRERRSLERKLQERQSSSDSGNQLAHAVVAGLEKLETGAVHLLLFHEFASLRAADEVFRAYTASAPQNRKDFLMLLKDLLIGRRLVHSLRRANLMLLVHVVLKISIGLSTGAVAGEVEKKLSGLLIDKILNSKPHFEMISLLLELIKRAVPGFETAIAQPEYLLIKFYLNCAQRFLQISEKVDCFNFLRITGELFDARPPEQLNEGVASLEIFDEVFRSLRAMSDEVIRRNPDSARLFYEVYKNRFANAVFINYVSNYLVSIE